jgi:uncharacterized protein YecE (DUF72 family)
MSLHIGTAGWALPRIYRDSFGAGESNLARYATRLNAAEINSSFYRPHKPAIYARWAAAVPKGFRFAVKVPKAITHEARLKGAGALLDAFLDESAALGDKRGPLLVQLPPSLAFDARSVRTFFGMLRRRFAGAVVCEPRHASWFKDNADRLLRDLQVSRVAADPARVSRAAEPGGDPRLAYFRWHGSPRIYFSSYDAARLKALVTAMRATKAREIWCVFDNTASGAAAGDALALQAMLRAP